MFGLSLRDIIHGPQPTQGFPGQGSYSGSQFAPIPAQAPMDNPIIPPAPESAAPAPQHHGLFAPGSKGQMIAGIIGDALAGASGGQPVFGQMLAQQRAQAAEEAQWGRRHDQQRQEHRSDQQWELDHRPPPVPNEFERALQSSGVMPGTPEWTKAMGTRATNMLDPIVTTMLPNGQMYSGPRSQLGGAMSGQMQSADNGEWGPVVNQKPGGPTQPASGTFRPGF